MTETLTHVATRIVSDVVIPFRAMPEIGISTDENDCLVLEVPYVPISPIITQDVVRLEGDDTFSLLGRRDWVINSGGMKIFPEALEEIMTPHIKFPFFFAALPDVDLGEKLVMLVETPTTKKAAIMAIAQQHLGANKHHVPRQIICLDAFVRTHSGKLDRKATIK
jgi:O-succinylbenzoic acid--CoA ligase